MTNDPLIRIPIRCDRTGIEYVATVCLSRVAKHHKHRDRVHANAVRLRRVFEKLADALPDLVVLYKGNLVILEHVLGHEKSLTRKLHSVTQSSLFAVETAAVAKRTGKQGKRASIAQSAAKVIDMDKYGVDESSASGKKLASDVAYCPLCGAELKRHGSIVLCPTHGSEPFEHAEHKD